MIGRGHRPLSCHSRSGEHDLGHTGATGDTVGHTGTHRDTISSLLTGNRDHTSQLAVKESYQVRTGKNIFWLI